MHHAHKLSMTCRNIITRREFNVNGKTVVYKNCNVIPNRFCLLPFSASNRYLSVHNDSSVSCWKCGKRHINNSFFCSNCNALQELKSSYNFFDLFGIKNSYDLNSVALGTKFRQLQTEFHPDKFSKADEEEKKYSVDLSSHVNKAYRTLLDPLERGLYLLKLHGITIPEESNVTDKIFLLEVMELNEELESLETRKEVSHFSKKIKETLEQLMIEVADAFKREDLSAAKEVLIRMKYFLSIQEKCKSKLLDVEESDGM